MLAWGFGQIAHGMKGVCAEIHQQLMNLAGVAQNRAALGIDVRLDFDRGRDRAAQHAACFLDDRLQAQRAHLPFGLPAERQYLAGQVLGAPAGGDHFADESPRAGIGGAILHRQFGVAQDGAENVVEVVRDAAGEHADGFHFLRLAKLVFQMRAFFFVAAFRQPGAQRRSDVSGGFLQHELVFGRVAARFVGHGQKAGQFALVQNGRRQGAMDRRKAFERRQRLVGQE
ncbi:MAG: hypothetical protein BWZ10_01163 [candidate division BRC1 bacterium ADurb.BinA364]|nr:MAG: hypothetical protein BWZ10_01163 [candidate division BRC1 bacterium ADurb.BinA364]